MDEAVRYQWLARHILPYEGEVRSWLLRHVRTLSVADANDLIQEAYSRLWTLDVDSINNGRAYFFAVVRNLVGEQARRARIVPMERMGEIDALSIISEEPGPERQISARQELERLFRILAGLPSRCRRTFELRKVEGLSIRETARRMGVGEGTVEKQLAKAFAHILDALGQGESGADSARANGDGQERTQQD